MCRYAFSGPYKAHFACFACRLAFKQPSFWDRDDVRGFELASRHPEDLQRREAKQNTTLAQLEKEYATGHACPQCRQPMIDMGLDFKAPRQTDKKAWQILQGMYRAGHAFHTCGCNGPGYIPKSKADYLHYLEQRRDLFTRNLKAAQSRDDIDHATRQETAAHWAASLEKVRAAMMAIDR
jgi:hypothetical protein